MDLIYGGPNRFDLFLRVLFPNFTPPPFINIWKVFQPKPNPQPPFTLPHPALISDLRVCGGSSGLSNLRVVLKHQFWKLNCTSKSMLQRRGNLLSWSSRASRQRLMPWWPFFAKLLKSALFSEKSPPIWKYGTFLKICRSEPNFSFNISIRR